MTQLRPATTGALNDCPSAVVHLADGQLMTSVAENV